jgi:hypothetical protein
MISPVSLIISDMQPINHKKISFVEALVPYPISQPCLTSPCFLITDCRTFKSMKMEHTPVVLPGYQISWKPTNWSKLEKGYACTCKHVCTHARACAPHTPQQSTAQHNSTFFQKDKQAKGQKPQPSTHPPTPRKKTATQHKIYLNCPAPQLSMQSKAVNTNPFWMPARGSFDVLTPIIMSAIRKKNAESAKQRRYTARYPTADSHCHVG